MNIKITTFHFCLMISIVSHAQINKAETFPHKTAEKPENIHAPIHPGADVFAAKSLSTNDFVKSSTWTVGDDFNHDFHSLQAAIESNEVKSGDKIYLHKGARGEGIPEYGICIYKDIEIIGDADSPPVIDASSQDAVSDRRCFYINTGVNVVFRNLRITKGYTKDESGGGILSYGNLSLYNVSLTQNHAGYAGGAICSSGNLTIDNGTIVNNTSQYGGAIAVFDNYSLTISNTFLSNNTATETGGAIYTWPGGSTTLDNCVIQKNEAKTGGVVTNEAPLYVNNCAIYDNHASGAGAILNLNIASIIDSRFYENTAQNDGGAIINQQYLTMKNSSLFKNKAIEYSGSAIKNFGNAHLYRVTISGNIGQSPFFCQSHASIEYACSAYLTNCTITENENDIANGITSYVGEDASNVTIDVSNSIIYGNKGGGKDIKYYGGIISFFDNNIICDNNYYNCSKDSMLLIGRLNMIGVDPLLKPLENINGLIPKHALDSNSPAINAIPANSTGELKASDDGNYTGTYLFDIGAYESDYVSNNTAMWSIYEAHNQISNRLNNVVVSFSNNMVWSPEINNLIIGKEALFDVTDPLTVRGTLYNYGTSRSLVLNEGIEFISNESGIHPHVIHAVDLSKINDNRFEVSIDFEPSYQQDTVIVEYGENEYSLSNTLHTGRLLSNSSRRVDKITLDIENAEGKYFRIRFANSLFNFLTEPRLIEFDTSNSRMLLGQKALEIRFDSNTQKIHLVNNGLEENKLRISIYNTLGQKCLPDSDFNSSIDISNLKTGIYIIRIENGHENYIEKFIVNM